MQSYRNNNIFIENLYKYIVQTNVKTYGDILMNVDSLIAYFSDNFTKLIDKTKEIANKINKINKINYNNYDVNLLFEQYKNIQTNLIAKQTKQKISDIQIKEIEETIFPYKYISPIYKILIDKEIDSQNKKIHKLNTLNNNKKNIEEKIENIKKQIEKLYPPPNMIITNNDIKIINETYIKMKIPTDIFLYHTKSGNCGKIIDIILDILIKIQIRYTNYKIT